MLAMWRLLCYEIAISGFHASQDMARKTLYLCIHQKRLLNYNADLPKNTTSGSRGAVSVAVDIFIGEIQAQ